MISSRTFSTPIASCLLLLAASLSPRLSADDGVVDLAIDPAAGVVLSTPGSYRLVRDVTMTASIAAISLNANDITIDLGGHTITGLGGVVSASGINASNDTGVTILNGRVRGFGGWGVTCGAKARVSGLIAEGNNTAGGAGGILTGQDGAVSNCTAIANNAASAGNAHGIRVGTGCIVSDSLAGDNIASGSGTAFGIYAINNCVIRNNVCDNNDSNSTGGTGSAYGIRADTSCRLLDNVCVNQTEGPDAASTAAGIYLIGEGNHVSGNTCNTNTVSGTGTAMGIHVAGSDCRIEGNHCALNIGTSITAGIYVDAAGASVEQNSCNSNSGPSTYAGILVSALGDEASIVSNRTRANGFFGIRLLSGSDGGFFGLNFTLDLHVDDGTNTEGTGALNNWP